MRHGLNVVVTVFQTPFAICALGLALGSNTNPEYRRMQGEK